MIVNHIHDYSEACVVKCLDHLLIFTDSCLAGSRICREASLRNIVVHRIVAPVKGFIILSLINRTEIITRHQLNMGNAQVLHVLERIYLLVCSLDLKLFAGGHFLKSSVFSTVVAHLKII